ncbi:hypothetical protein ACP3TB_07990 [Rahnella variigena]|uniref:hypothetical protein n=1 Tax=Rahnella variigena TaxID=574964 RepID=UPI003CF224E5
MVDIALFNRFIQLGRVEPVEYSIPSYQLIEDKAINPKHLDIRDKRLGLIQGLLNDPNFLFEIASNLKSNILINHAILVGTNVQNLHRFLNLYWKYGQDLNALLPSYVYSGGMGIQRLAGTKKRGMPIRFLTPTIQASPGVNTEESDKIKFLSAMKKYGLKGQKVSLRYVYEEMRKDHYAGELIASEIEGRAARVPSYRVFVYWCNKLISKDEIARKQTSPGDYERNKRALRGKATDHTEVPGSCFELDSTVLDVHIVSEFRRNHVLGRPTVYCVVDKESRMIVGLHVSMEYASWRAGRQALINSFTSKKAYCAEYFIEIDEEEWPCQHVPQRLLCDRGEFICEQAEKLAVPLIGHLSIAPLTVQT